MRQFADSLLRPSVGMWILISGNAVNIVFNYLLIYGKCGMPELGALGAGISTLGSRVLMTVVFAVVLLRGQAYAPMRKAFLHTHESVGEMLSITRTSMPISLQMAMETGTFTFGGVMMGWLGTVELASYQVILTISTLGFMFYYSIGAAWLSVCQTTWDAATRRKCAARHGLAITYCSQWLLRCRSCFISPKSRW